MNEHSPEPWHWSERGLRDGGGAPLLFSGIHLPDSADAIAAATANVARAAACVNACAGIATPATATAAQWAAEHLERAKEHAAMLYYETWRYREEHPGLAFHPLDEMHRGQQNTAMELLRIMCGGDHDEVVRVCDPFEDAFLAWKAQREPR